MAGTTLDNLDFNLIMYEIEMQDGSIEYDIDINWMPAGAFYRITNDVEEETIHPNRPSEETILGVKVNHLTAVTRDSWVIHPVEAGTEQYEEAKSICKINLRVERDDTRSTEPVHGRWFPPRIYLGNLPLGIGPGKSEGVEVTITALGPNGKPDKKGTKTRGVTNAIGGSRGDDDD